MKSRSKLHCIISHIDNFSVRLHRFHINKWINIISYANSFHQLCWCWVQQHYFIDFLRKFYGFKIPFFNLQWWKVLKQRNNLSNFYEIPIIFCVIVLFDHRFLHRQVKKRPQNSISNVFIWNIELITISEVFLSDEWFKLVASK